MKKETSANFLLLASLFCLLVYASSCSNDDVGAEENETLCANEPDSVVNGQVVCDLDFIAQYPGTACCISGPITAEPGVAKTFTYNSNIPDANVTWTVLSGSITLTSGQGTTSGTFTFGDDFTTGCIRALGENEISCGEPFSISSN